MAKVRWKYKIEWGDVVARAEYNVNLFVCDLYTAVGAWSVTNYVDTTHLNSEGAILASDAIRTAFTAKGR